MGDVVKDVGDTYTLAEWQAEMERRGKLDCAFVCPSCGDTLTPKESIELGFKPDDAATKCRHRLLEDGKCDWCAFGLFCGPVAVTCEDGTVVHAFRFAEAVAS